VVIELSFLQSSEVDIDEEVSEIPQSEPFIVVVGDPNAAAANSQAFICCEKRTIIESKCVKAALVHLIMSYFIFNIVYPKGIHNLMVFLQHHVYNLLDQQKIAASVKTLLNNMEKL